MRRLILFVFLCLSFFELTAQNNAWNRDSVDVLSYRLYLESKWDSLCEYGKKAIDHQVDFTLLRLRLGYAEIQRKQISHAIKHYEWVLQRDRYHETALYYTWFCWSQLNQPEMAVSFIKRQPISTQKYYRWKPNKLISLGYESSYKITTTSFRSNAWYQSLQFKNQLGYRWQMNHQLHAYHQTLNEPKLTSIQNNTNISINEIGYYHQSMISMDPRWQLKLMGHFIHTPFNSITYNNIIGGISLKYLKPYFQIQGAYYSGRVTDTLQHQYDLTLDFQPWGDDRFYGISTASLQQRNAKQTFNFKQVLGIRMFKQLWLEGNITMGRFNYRLENEGLYLYNAIDPNQIKWGVTAYLTLGKHSLIKTGYTFENRNFFLDPNQFSQHAINTSFTWTF